MDERWTEESDGSLRYDPWAGEDIGATAKHLVTMFAATGATTRAKFNDIELTARVGDTADNIVAYYSAESKRRYEAYTSTPGAESRACYREA